MPSNSHHWMGFISLWCSLVITPETWFHRTLRFVKQGWVVATNNSVASLLSWRQTIRLNKKFKKVSKALNSISKQISSYQFKWQENHEEQVGEKKTHTHSNRLEESPARILEVRDARSSPTDTGVSIVSLKLRPRSAICFTGNGTSPFRRLLCCQSLLCDDTSHWAFDSKTKTLWTWVK